jgi:plastocyanin
MARNIEVLISGFAFDQQDISISVGDTVTWINDDGGSHTVTQDTTSGLPIAEIALGANEYSPRQTFGTAGVLNYHCRFHPHMTGSVTVT